VFSAERSRLGSIRVIAVVVLCAVAALFVALAAPSRADAAHTSGAGFRAKPAN
jgi:hypothetical protein